MSKKLLTLFTVFGIAIQSTGGGWKQRHIGLSGGAPPPMYPYQP